MRKRFGTTKGVTRIGLTQTARRIEMETNKSVGTVDYISAPKPGKDQWFMPVVLNQSGTKIKFYCKFDPTPNKSSALPQDMIAVGLAGRITEVVMTLHHEKGVQMKDPVVEIAKWIKIGQDAYNKATTNVVDEIKNAFPGATVDDDIDDEVPF